MSVQTCVIWGDKKGMEVVDDAVRWRGLVLVVAAIIFLQARRDHSVSK